MNNIINIESKHTPKNTAQQAQIGHALYITGPSQIRRLPRAVAPSHKPWQRPSKFLGATLETKERPRGEINNSATVRKKYKTNITHQSDFKAMAEASSILRNSLPEGYPLTQERIIKNK